MPPTGAESPGHSGADATFTGNNLDLATSQPGQTTAAETDVEGTVPGGRDPEVLSPTPPGQSLEQLKTECLSRGEVPKGEVLKFILEDGFIAYNPSNVIQQNIGVRNVDCIAARVERVGDELSSSVQLFQKATTQSGDVWVSLPGEAGRAFHTRQPTPADEAAKRVLISETDKGTEADAPFGPASYQDPAIAIGKLGGTEFVVMAVVNAQEQHRVETAPAERRSSYHQEFWAGTNLGNLEKIAEGPNSRKGTRLVSLGANKWGVFNRPQSPQGEQFGPGRITYGEFEATNAEQFNAGLAASLASVDTVIPGLCTNDQWVGPNQGWPLKDGRIGMVGHIARMVDASTGVREYCGFSFIYDPKMNTTQEVQIIATKASFETVSPRSDRQDLNEVIYPGGANVLEDAKLRLYCGVSDNAAGYVDIDDPFAGLRLAL